MARSVTRFYIKMTKCPKHKYGAEYKNIGNYIVKCEKCGKFLSLEEEFQGHYKEDWDRDVFIKKINVSVGGATATVDYELR